MKCNQCELLSINGVTCHETGCPNQNKVWNREDQEWQTPEPDEDDCFEDIGLDEDTAWLLGETDED